MHVFKIAALGTLNKNVVLFIKGTPYKARILEFGSNKCVVQGFKYTAVADVLANPPYKTPHLQS